MRAVNHTHPVHDEGQERISMFRIVMNRIAQASESIWLGITFLLFIVMGPFSVIAVMYGLWALATRENKETLAEPVSC